MPLIAVLTVQVGHEVTESQWDVFTLELGKFEWELVDPLSGTWCGAYEEDATEDEAVAMAMDDVADAAEAAKIEHFDAVVHFGPHTPSIFSDEDYEESDGEGGESEPEK